MSKTLSELLNREPPSEFWAQRTVDTACKMLCELYDGADREKVFELASQLKREVLEEANGTSNLSVLLDCFDQEEFGKVESSYRRGYVHGYIAALNDRDRNAADVCNDHLNNTLHRWRSLGDVSEMEPPPHLQ